MKKIITASLAALLLLAGCVETDQIGEKYNDFAKCLTQKNARFFGTYWCPHCKEQKKLFGKALKYVNYVECDPAGKNSQTELCKKEKVQWYPTWVFADNSRKNGVLTMEELAKKTGCALPE